MATPPVFSPLQVLDAATMSKVGLWLVKTQTIGSAVSSVVVTDAFSADFENYVVTVSGGTHSTGTGTMTFKLGASGTGYYSGATIVTYSTNAVTGTAVNNGAVWNVGMANSSALNAHVTLMGPYLAKPTSYSSFDSNGTSQARNWVGYHSVSTSYTEFTLGVTAGTMTGGTISVYGYNPG